MSGGQLPDTEVAGPYPFDVDKLRKEVPGTLAPALCYVSYLKRA